jgi:hypothetical protein
VTSETPPPLGVAIVAFRSADVILPCLESVFASRDVALRVAVTDNASDDDTAALVSDWAARRAAERDNFSFAELPAGGTSAPTATLTLLRSEFNGGYAYGVNAGLSLLLRDPELTLFWVLNPDCVVPPETAAAYARAGADGRFALMSGRTVYCEDPHRIQTDGGRINRWTGVCSSVNAGRDAEAAPMPDAASLDFLTGGNVVASRRFIERAGLMPEDYFLYYEEVEWALRRGDLPLRLADGVLVRHHGGTAIGSGTASRGASPFAHYFNVRNRLRFLRRNRPWATPFGLAHALAKAGQLALAGARAEALAVLAGALGLLPPAAIRERIAPGKARERAFGSDQ